MQVIGQAPFRFRWVFDYSDGKPSVRGVWSYHSNTDKAASAFMQSKNNLLYAAIEAQDTHKNACLRVAECKGEDFCNFEWVASANIPGVVRKDYTTEGIIIGIRLISRDLQVTAYQSGEIESEYRTTNDTIYHYGKLDNA